MPKTIAFSKVPSPQAMEPHHKRAMTLYSVFTMLWVPPVLNTGVLAILQEAPN